MQSEGAIQNVGEVIFSLVLFIKTFFQGLGLLPAPCEQPLQYTLGVVDSRFGISESEVLQAAEQAEKVWENAAGKNLFEYNKESGLLVQFVYDERQQKTQAGQDLQKRLDILNVEESEREAKAQVVKYEQAKGEYDQKQSAYEQAVKRYNDRVERMNRRGGATEAQQEDLVQEHEALQDQGQEVEKARQRVNSLVSTTNQYIEVNRSLVETYNAEVTTFQDRYGGEGEAFDQGVYTGRDITIYQYDDTPRLVMVLAHEFGHALGIEHTEAPEALMYYLLRDQDIGMLTLQNADKEALHAVCQAPKFPWLR